jgi:hypothetical protein
MRWRWPSHDKGATLLVDLGADHQRSLALLSRWRAAQASVAPTPAGSCWPGPSERDHEFA